MTPEDIITSTITEFCRITGSGRSKVYELINDGSIKSIKIGKRRLVVVDSYRQLVKEELASQQAAASAPKPARA